MWARTLLLGAIAAVMLLGTAGTAGAYELSVSDSSNRAGASQLLGSTVTGDVFVFVGPTSGIAKVEFYLDDPERSGGPRQVEGVAPYDFAGTKSDDSAIPFNTQTVADGAHTITAAITRSVGGVEVVHAQFTVDNSTETPASSYELLISGSATRSEPVPLEGETASGDIFVFAGPTDGISNVEFYLDDPERSGEPHQVEGVAPYDFAGTNTDDSAIPFNTQTIADGAHTITAAISRAVGGVEFVEAQFTVDNSTEAPASSYELLLSGSATRSEPVPLEGETASGDIFVFAGPAEDIVKVEFYLDDTERSGEPRQVENRPPYDFAGTNTDNSAIAFNTREVANGAHTITAAISRAVGGVELVHAGFEVSNEAVSGCGPLPCSEALIDELPYTLDFNEDRGKILDANGVGTGFTYLDVPQNGTGYISGNLLADTTAGALRVTTTSGLNSGASNSQDNALGIGIDAPSQKTAISTMIDSPPAGSGKYEQAGIWFGNDGDNFDKLVVVSTKSGTKIEHHLEVGGNRAASEITGKLNLSGSAVTLTIEADPETRQLSAFYQVGIGAKQSLGSFEAPGELFSFDAAGIDPTIGTRSFGGILASNRNSSAPLTYAFDQFTVYDASTSAPGGTDTPEISFDRSTFPVSTPTSMDWGPDGRLYVLELFGKIHALSLDADQNVVSDEVITALGTRLALGLTVDPQSTAGNVILWASHSSPSLDNGVPNSGKVTRLSGTGFSNRTDVITGLPRAKANHATNSLHFGPDGRLYMAQGGNTGAGAPNNANTEFGTMEEQPLSAAMLVADVRSTSFDGSCDNEEDIFGPPPCDVEVYSSGLRNTYDFVWHSNGFMYGPDNGLGVSGSFPPSPTPPCFGLASTASWTSGGQNPGDQPDGLNLLEAGKYYGHPDPYRDECVFKDGSYQGVPTPANYEPPILKLGLNRSANGTIEYRADAFCGDLREDLLIANYSVGDDLTRVQLSADGRSVEKASSLVGGFNDPLPIAQAPDGTLYVGELGAGRVTALEPIDLGCWGSAPDAPESILDAGGAALDGLIYLVGGKTASGYRSTVRVFDPATGAWDEVANLPGPAVENPAVVAHDGKLYAFGGSTAPFSGAVANAAVFDPATGEWSSLPDMPTPRGGAAAESLGGKIYVVGGMDVSGASVDAVEVFDPGSVGWSPGPSMGTRRDNPGIAALDGDLYVFGGRTRNADGSSPDPTLRSVEMLDPASGTWAAREPMPTGRRTMAVGRLNGRAQLVGGEIRPDGGAFAQNEEYDAVTDSWRVLRRVPTGRHGAIAGTVAGKLYVIGGGDTGGSAFTSINEVFSFQN